MTTRNWARFRSVRFSGWNWGRGSACRRCPCRNCCCCCARTAQGHAWFPAEVAGGCGGTAGPDAERRLARVAVVLRVSVIWIDLWSRPGCLCASLFDDTAAAKLGAGDAVGRWLAKVARDALLAEVTRGRTAEGGLRGRAGSRHHGFCYGGAGNYRLEEARVNAASPADWKRAADAGCAAFYVSAAACPAMGEAALVFGPPGLTAYVFTAR